MITTFQQIKSDTPSYEPLKAKYDQLLSSLQMASSSNERIETVRTWDQLRREFNTWEALVHLRFNQDTTNEQFKKDREYADELRPKLTELDVAMKRLLVSFSSIDSNTRN